MGRSWPAMRTKLHCMYCNCTCNLLADRLLPEAMDTDALMFTVFRVAHWCTCDIILQRNTLEPRRTFKQPFTNICLQTWERKEQRKKKGMNVWDILKGFKGKLNGRGNYFPMLLHSLKKKLHSPVKLCGNNMRWKKQTIFQWFWEQTQSFSSDTNVMQENANVLRANAKSIQNIFHVFFNHHAPIGAP